MNFINFGRKIDQAYLSQLNQDLFSADDGEAYEQSMKNKPVLSQIEDNSNSNPTDLVFHLYNFIFHKV